jgi:hypothetical protein
MKPETCSLGVSRPSCAAAPAGVAVVGGGVRDVVLITGAPGSGKSTKAHELALAGYLHLEREQYPDDEAFRSAVETLTRTKAKVAVVRCCFTPGELAYWLKFTGATQHIELDPGIDTARSRVVERANADWRGELCGVERWYRGRAQTVSAGRWW